MNNWEFLEGGFRGRSLLAAVSFLAMASLGVAQQPAVDLKDPILPRMPERSSWTVSIRQRAQAPAPDSTGKQPAQSPNDVTAAIAKDGKTYRVIYSKPVNGYSEIWFVNGTTLALLPGGNRAAIVNPVLFPLTGFSSSDFEDFSWVMKQNFIGLQTVAKRPMLAFKADNLTRPFTAREDFLVDQLRRAKQLGSPLDDPDAPFKPQQPPPPPESPKAGRQKILKLLGLGPDISAWLDPETKRPFLMTSGENLISIAYSTAVVPLAPPTSILARLTKAQERAISNNKRPSNPRP